MHMNLDDLIIFNYNNTVADRLQISAQLCTVNGRIILMYHILRTVSEIDFFVILCNSRIEVDLRFCRRSLRFLCFRRRFCAFERIQHSAQNDAESLAAGIHDICLFQSGQHFGGLLQNGIRLIQHSLPESDGIQILLCKFLRFVGSHAGYCENCTLRRLHDGFICTLDANCQRVGEICILGSCHSAQSLGKTAEQKRGDDAGVSASAPQHRRRSYICDGRYSNIIA